MPNKTSIIFKIFLSFFILTMEGCYMVTHYDDLMVLKRLADSQKEAEDYLKRQESLFDKLKNDLKNNRLKKGMSKEAIIYAYGEPILSKPVENQAEIKEVLSFRHPTEYFSSDWVMLYFDQEQRLCSWEFKPYRDKK